MTREAMFEAGGAGLGLCLAAAAAFAPAAGGWPALVGLGLVIGWIAWRYARDFVVPDGAALAFAALALALRLGVDGVSAEAAAAALAAGALCGGALWAVREAFYRLRGHDGLGFGDVKLAAGCGVLLGASGFALALLAASLAGIAAALVARRTKLPFGALLAPAALLTWAAGLAPLPGPLG